MNIFKSVRSLTMLVAGAALVAALAISPAAQAGHGKSVKKNCHSTTIKIHYGGSCYKPKHYSKKYLHSYGHHHSPQYVKGYYSIKRHPYRNGRLRSYAGDGCVGGHALPSRGLKHLPTTHQRRFNRHGYWGHHYRASYDRARYGHRGMHYRASKHFRHCR